MDDTNNPPAVVYCPKCRDGGGDCIYLHPGDRTATGVQEYIYRCDGCKGKVTIRHHRSQPGRYLHVGYQPLPKTR